jgi:hypothetical protein
VDSEDEMLSNAEDSEVHSPRRKRRRLDDSSDVERSEDDFGDNLEVDLREKEFTRNISLQVILCGMLLVHTQIS